MRLRQGCRSCHCFRHIRNLPNAYCALFRLLFLMKRGDSALQNRIRSRKSAGLDRLSFAQFDQHGTLIQTFIDRIDRRCSFDHDWVSIKLLRVGPQLKQGKRLFCTAIKRTHHFPALPPNPGRSKTFVFERRLCRKRCHTYPEPHVTERTRTAPLFRLTDLSVVSQFEISLGVESDLWLLVTPTMQCACRVRSHLCENVGSS